MHRTHRFMGGMPGSRLVEFHKQHGIEDGRGGPRAYKPSAPTPTPPPEDPNKRLVRMVLVVVGVAVSVFLFSLWLLWCTGFLGVVEISGTAGR